MRWYPWRIWGKLYLCSPDCSMEADINYLMGESSTCSGSCCCIYKHAAGFTAGTVDSCSLKTTEAIKLEMMRAVSSECQQATLIHYKAVYGPLYSVTMYNNLHVVHLSASSSNWNSVLISRPQLVAPPHPPSCRVTDPSLSLHLCSSQRFSRGLNKRRWVAALTGTWNIPILYKHYITLF